jgi:glutathione S-transferase
VKLYGATGSCSAASHIALVEANADFEVIKLDLKSDRKLPDGRALSDINPKGYVPVLELDDGSFLTENVAVLQYIADQYPKSGLAPAIGTMDRYRLQEWLAFINSEVHKAYSHFFNPKLPAEMRQILTNSLNTRYKYIDTRLAGKNYLMGDQFTVADCYLFVVSSWAPALKYDLSGNENVLKWQKRVAARDSVRKVTNKE